MRTLTSTPNNHPDNHQKDDASTAHAAGEWIGPYQIIRELGRGGMGAVYLAHQEKPIQRDVALKLIKPGMDSREIIARFEAERQALALMNHPYIARVIDAGTSERGEPYFVMEYVPGVPITEFCDINRMSTQERLRLFSAVCEGVQHAHFKGIVHRDLKPSNVLVTEQDGRPVPKIIDFGIAKAIFGQVLTEKTLQTMSGAAIGTPVYMSPEQAAMNDAEVDTRTDIYALGVLLNELLTGAPPFAGPELEKAGLLEMLRIIRENDPPKPSSRFLATDELTTSIAGKRGTAPSALRRQLQGDLDWIILKALEKDKKRRFATVSEFAADLERHLADEPVSARPPSMAYRTKKFISRRRGLVIATAVVTVAVLAGLVVSSLLYFRSEAARIEADHQAYVANIAAANSDITAGDLLEARSRLLAIRSSLRNWEWRYLWSRQDSSIKTLWGSPTQEWLIAGPQQGESAGLDLGRGSFSFGVDGRVYLARMRPSVSFMQAWGKDGLSLPASGSISRAWIDVDPRGRMIPSVGTKPGPLDVIDGPTGAVIASLPAHAWVRAAFGPEGDRIATITHDGHVRIWNTDNASLMKSLDCTVSRWSSTDQPMGTGFDFWFFGFENEGRTLAIGCGPRLDLVDLTTNALEQTKILEDFDYLPIVGNQFVSSHGRIVIPVVDSVGNKIVGESRKREICIWDVHSGKKTQNLADETSGPIVMAVGRRHSWFATSGADRTIRLRDLSTGETIAVFVGHESPITALDFDPDDKRLWSLQGEGEEIRIWDIEQARLSFGRSLPVERADCVALSADDRVLATAAVRSPRISILNLSTGATQTLDPGQDVNALVMSDKGHCLAAGMSNGDVKVWRLSERGAALSFTYSKKPPNDEHVTYFGFSAVVDLSGDGSRVSAGWPDGEMRTWDLIRSDQQIFQSKTTKRIAFIRLDSSGRRLLVGTEPAPVLSGLSGDLQIWNVDTGLCELTIPETQAANGIWSPDGRLLLTVDRQHVEMWDARTGASLFRVPVGVSPGTGLAFSADGSRFLVAGWDDASSTSMLKVWETGTCTSLLALGSNRNVWRDVGFSKDGARVIAATGNAVRIWDTFSPYPPGSKDLADQLRTKFGLVDDVVAWLRKDGDLTPDRQNGAIEIARLMGNLPAWRLSAMSCEITKTPPRSREEYRRALRLAETAEHAAPKYESAIRALGMARFRLGEYKASLIDLDRSLKAGNEDNFILSFATRSAFRVMALSKLGQDAAARQELDILNKFMAGDSTAWNLYSDGRATADLKRLAVEAKAMVAKK